MPAPWKVLSSRTTYADQWLKLRTDRCQSSRGHILEAYHVLEFPDWVNVVALTNENRLILVKEYRHGAGEVLLGLPSGTREQNDQNPEQTTRRELEEETGYTGGEYRFLGSYFANPATQRNRVSTFLAWGVQNNGTPSLDPSEDIEVVTEDFIPFMRKIWSGGVSMQGLHLAAVHLALGFLATEELKPSDPLLALRNQLFNIAR